MTAQIEVTSLGIKVAAQRWGEETGIPILALHGWLDNSASFCPLVDYLPGKLILAPDLPGHGLSGHLPESGLYSLQSYTSVVMAFIRTFKWRRFAIIGHSLGAGIGAAIAAAYPERVSQVVMIDAVAPPISAPGDALRQLRQDLQMLQSNLRMSLAVYQDLDEAVEVRRVVSGSTREAAQLITLRDTLSERRVFVPRSDPKLHLKSHSWVCKEQAEAIMRGVECPVLIIRPDHGFLAQWLEHKECLWPQKIVVADVEGRHHVHMTSPALVGKLILEFM